MTVYGYARVSTDGQPPESQLRALTRAIAERNTPQPQTPEAKMRATY
jgi:DNA invertase Pin-like site-specific DNA recombinase